MKTRANKLKPLPGLVPRALEYDISSRTPISGRSPLKNNDTQIKPSNKNILAEYNNFQRYENENIDPSESKQSPIQSQENNNHNQQMDYKSPLILVGTPKKVQKMDTEHFSSKEILHHKPSESPFSTFVKGLSPIHVNLSSPNLIFKHTHRYTIILLMIILLVFPYH